MIVNHTLSFFKGLGLGYLKEQTCKPFTGTSHKFVFLFVVLEIEVLEGYKGKAFKQ